MAHADPVVIATIPVGSSPQGVGVNPTTNRVYVANSVSSTVSVIDGATNSVITAVPVGVNPHGVGVNPSTNRVYVAIQYCLPPASIFSTSSTGPPTASSPV